LFSVRLFSVFSSDLSEPAISTQNLRVYPATARTSQEGHYVGDVDWLTYTLQRGHLADLCDLLFTLAL
jgi:hypothetical protein